MAIVLIEEILVGLDEVKGSLEQAVTTLASVIDDIHPELVPHLQARMERTLLQPLAAHVAALEELLATMADLA